MNKQQHVIPKVIRRKMKLIDFYCKQRDIRMLRTIRDTSANLLVDIYHHSAGTLSFFHDLEKRYYTHSEIMNKANTKLRAGQYLMTVILPYKPNVVFTSNIDRVTQDN